MQVKDLSTWNVKTYNLNGTGKMDYTYSMGMRYKLYVMEPDYNSVEKAKKKMNEVLNEN